MESPSFRRLLDDPDLSIGVLISEFTTPGIGHIIKGAGCHFAFVDMEHAALGYETVKCALRWLHDAGVASLVRPPSQDYHDVARVCDVGAQGVMPPMLSTAKQARSIIRHMKYVPAGERGVALGIAHDDYQTGPVEAKLAAANERTCLVALIETAEGVENSDEIAAVEGVDCLWIGHFDLSCSLGIPGQFDHPDFRRAVSRVVQTAARHHKVVGRLVSNIAEGIELFQQGFRMIVYSSDVRLLQQALSDGVNGLRS